MLGGFETLKDAFALTGGRPVRFLRSIVQALVSPMLSVRQHTANCGRVAGEFIDNHDAWFIADAVNLPQEAFGRVLIAPLLVENIQYDAVLIDCSPQRVASAIDLQQHLVCVRIVACPC